MALGAVFPACGAQLRCWTRGRFLPPSWMSGSSMGGLCFPIRAPSSQHSVPALSTSILVQGALDFWGSLMLGDQGRGGLRILCQHGAPLPWQRCDAGGCLDAGVSVPLVSPWVSLGANIRV